MQGRGAARLSEPAYLDRVPPAPPLTPADPKAAARMDQAMNVNDWYLFQGVNSVIGFHRVVGPRLMGLPPDETAIAAAMPKADVVLNELARLLGEQDHICSTSCISPKSTRHPRQARKADTDAGAGD